MEHIQTTASQTTTTAQAPPAPQTQTLDQPNGATTPQPQLERLFNGQTLSLQPVTTTTPPAVVDATLPAPPPQSLARRRGRIARLPKVHRDIVNRMLWNGVPYKNIVAAIHEVGFNISERNISNWANGGYLEWRFEQSLVIENRLSQDHLVDHLRRDDASELAEVGLQAATMRLSQIFLQKAARAENVEANLETFSKMVDLLSRLNREITFLQKQRDDSRRTLGPAHDVARIKNEEQNSARYIECDFSAPEAPDCGFEPPAVPPLLPQYPTSSELELRDLQKKRREERERVEHNLALLQAFSPKNPTPAPASEPSQPTAPSPSTN